MWITSCCHIHIQPKLTVLQILQYIKHKNNIELNGSAQVTSLYLPDILPSNAELSQLKVQL